MCDNPVFENKIVKGKIITHFKRPCGQCIGCKIDNQLIWINRCNSEYVKNRSTFLTLTYDDNHLRYHPKSLYPSLCKDDVRKFIDRLRHYCKSHILPELSNPNFSYFAVGEYGDTFQRPHNHLLIFGLDFHDCTYIYRDLWKFGNIKSLPILSGGIRYVVDYLTKSLNSSVAQQLYDDKYIERPFYITSKGLGSEFFYMNREEISKTGFIKIGSRTCCVPTYYKNLFQTFNSEDIAIYEHEHFTSIQSILADMKKQGFTSYNEYILYQRRANELAYEARLHNNGRPCLPSYYENKGLTDNTLINISLEV